MQYVWDEENKILLINGTSTKGHWSEMPMKLSHYANRIIQVYIDQETNRRVFNIIKDRYNRPGEFTPTQDEFDYIFEQLIGS